MNNSKLINQDSGNFEYYTPKFIIERAMEVMGRIDLDVASSEEANKIVNAKTYFSIEDDSLNREWYGKVWMNHPFSRVNNPLFVNKLIKEYESGNISEAICITFASTSEKWFQPLFKYIQCFLYPRTNYYDSDGNKKVGVTKGSVITYLGENELKFKEVFKDLGSIK